MLLDRVISYWQESYDDAPNLNIQKLGFAYVGTYLILCTTATLFLWFCCHLFANLHWRFPHYESYHLPLCPTISRFFGFAHSDSPYVINEAPDAEDRYEAQPKVNTEEIVVFSENYSASQREQRPAYYNIDNIPYRLRGPLKFVCVLLVTGPLTYLVTFIWWIFSTIILWVAGFLAQTIVMYCGEVAVFPCCVTFVTALTIYCCGRMSGLWLRESYLWSFWNRLRLLCGCHPPPLKLHANPCGLVIKESSAHVFRTVQVWFGLLLYGTGVFFNVDPLYQPFPQVSGYVRHPISAAISCPVNSTVDIQTSVQMLKPGVAMVSYWADVSNVLGNTTNVTIPDMSPFFPTFGFAFLVWGGTLFYLALFPWIILVVCVVVGYIFMFFDLFVWETPQPSRASPAITFCACAPWIAALRVLIHYMIGPLMWYLLPWPLTQFLLPEHLQLPGIFLILTIIIAKMYYQWIRHVRVQWKNGEFTAIVRLFNQLRTAAAQVNNESGEKDSLVGIAASVPRS